MSQGTDFRFPSGSPSSVLFTTNQSVVVWVVRPPFPSTKVSFLSRHTPRVPVPSLPLFPEPAPIHDSPSSDVYFVHPPLQRPPPQYRDPNPCCRKGGDSDVRVPGRVPVHTLTGRTCRSREGSSLNSVLPPFRLLPPLREPDGATPQIDHKTSGSVSTPVPRFGDRVRSRIHLGRSLLTLRTVSPHRPALGTFD